MSEESDPDSEVCAGLRKRRRSAHTLPLLFMPELEAEQHFDLDEGCQDEVVREGTQLFERFVHEEITKVGLEPPVECLPPSSVRSPQGYRNPMWAKAGQELRMMADEFAKSRDRQRVKRRAAELGICEVTGAQFQDMLSQLFFQDMVTKERIMILFFFCSDVVIRTLRHGIDLFKQYFHWSISFISQRVCSWVRQEGGWAAVLTNSVQYLQKILLFSGAVVLACLSVHHLLKR